MSGSGEREQRREVSVGHLALLMALVIGLAAFSILLIWLSVLDIRAGRDAMNAFFQFIMGLAGLALAGKSLADMTRMRLSSGEKPVEVVSVIQCVDCGHSAERNFSDGEYVGMLTGERCPECGGPVYVARIYVKGGGEERRQRRILGLPAAA